MKLRNRIMSWILAPGAYAVWHALGNPDEWKEGKQSVIHIPTDVDIGTGEPMWIITDLLGGFFCDQFVPKSGRVGALGYLDRHFVHGRALKVKRHLRRKARQKPKHDLFVLMTQLKGKAE